MVRFVRTEPKMSSGGRCVAEISHEPQNILSMYDGCPGVRRTWGYHQPTASPRCGTPRASHGRPAAPGESFTVMPQVRLTSPGVRATVYIT